MMMMMMMMMTIMMMMMVMMVVIMMMTMMVESSSGVVEWSSGVVKWSSRIVEWSSERAKLLLGKDLYAQILVEFMKHFASSFQYLSFNISKDILCTDFGRIHETFCINFSISEIPYSIAPL